MVMLTSRIFRLYFVDPFKPSYIEMEKAPLMANQVTNPLLNPVLISLQLYTHLQLLHHLPDAYMSQF